MKQEQQKANSYKFVEEAYKFIESHLLQCMEPCDISWCLWAVKMKVHFYSVALNRANKDKLSQELLLLCCVCVAIGI